MAIASLPLPIQLALDSLASFLESHAVKYGRSGERWRGMRCDRRQHILGVASAMLRGCSLQHDGLVCLITRFWARPMSIAEISTLAGISTKTASRCMGDMEDLGLIERAQIKRRNPQTGLLEVSIGIRRFTKKFWQALGLFDIYQRSVLWAKKEARRRLLMPFKAISTKAKSYGSAAGQVVKAVISRLANPDAERRRSRQQILLNVFQRQRK